MFKKFVDFVFGEPRLKPDRPVASHAVPMLANYLPYRAYDREKELFYNAGGLGFALELSPLVGADERSADILGQVFTDGLLPGMCLQLQAVQSPRVGEIIKEFALPRYTAGGVFRKIAEYRREYMRDGTWKTMSSDGPFSLRNHRIVLSVSAEMGKVSPDEMIVVRENMTSVLESINVLVRRMDPVALISHIDDLMTLSFEGTEHVSSYSDMDPISDQCVRRDMQMVVQPERLVISCEPLKAVATLDDRTLFDKIKPDKFDYRFFSVRNLPKHWAPWDVQKLVGDMFIDKLRHGCPSVTSLSIVVEDEAASSSLVNWKFTRTTSLADSKSARLLPMLKDQSQEWEDVQQKLRLGQKLVKAHYTVGIMSPLGQGDANERMIKSVYKAAGWDLLDERHLQVMTLLCCFPMTFGGGLDRDVKRMRRFRRMLSQTAANLSPFQGEYLGGNLAHVLFVGRRGQPFYWSPFENTAGNHNVAVFGKSGSGKSVMLQELCTALAGVGSKIIVIDDGRSFEHMCHMLEGDFIEFKLSTGFSLNPFSMIDESLSSSDPDYLVDALSMLKSIIGQMARFVDRLNDAERGLIDHAVATVWEASNVDGTIDMVRDILNEGGPVGHDLATSLQPFTSGGTYGKFFQGKASLDLTNDFTVFELSDLSGREELRNVVLTAIMFLSSQAMRKLDRSIPKALLIDEAWQMLGSGSMATFVETYARTCRKYRGSLITATQSLNDYYKSDGAIAALENSDWSLVLQQKAETISGFADRGRFEMDGYTRSILHSLKRNGTDYSDVLIRGPEVQAVGRLVLDPYSGTLYSSSPVVFAAIEELVAKGYTMGEAIERVAFPKRFHANDVALTDIPEAAE